MIRYLTSFTGNREKAIELLLETSPDHPNFYNGTNYLKFLLILPDALKACLLASASGGDIFHNTVKLVASSLLARNQLTAGNLYAKENHLTNRYPIIVHGRKGI